MHSYFLRLVPVSSVGGVESEILLNCNMSTCFDFGRSSKQPGSPPRGNASTFVKFRQNNRRL